MHRRKLRLSLGTRVMRRAGTKTKVIPKGAEKKGPKFRFPRYQKTRPRVRLAQLMAKAS